MIANENNRRTTKLAACICAASLFASSNVSANPGGGTVVHGSANINSSGNTLTVTNTPGTVINWQQFNIGQNEITRFVQQSASSSVLNRVTGPNLSQIYGQLQSNGQVYLVNPHGIIFGQNAVIDTAGLIATTLNISNHDFLDGKLRFHDLANSAEILNQGFIHTSNDGEVMLIAPTVTNEGTITVEQGSITLAAGNSVTIDSLNHDAISFEVQAPDDAVVNLGEMMSDGGSIGVFAGSIRNQGIVSANAITVDDSGNIRFVASSSISLDQDSVVSASSITRDAGSISISARSQDSQAPAMVIHNGSVVGDGQQGGEVTIDADHVLTAGSISSNGVASGGSIDVTADSIRATTHARFEADTVHGKGGDIHLYAKDSLLTSATHSASGKQGGSVQLLSDGNISLASSRLYAQGRSDGGEIRVGGGIEGGEGLPVSRSTLVNENSIISARSLLTGKGGTVVIWSQQRTAFFGDISVAGGAVFGDGGFAEISSPGILQYSGNVDRTALNGDSGILLLDPLNINIIGGSSGSLSVLELVDPANIANNDNFGSDIDLFNLFNANQTITSPVLPLSNGNIIVTDPNDTAGMGAAYLFADDGSLISTLAGGNSLDALSSGGATAVGLGANAIISSPDWNVTAGAWTWIDGTTGAIGGSVGPNVHSVTIGNPLSITGSAPGDAVGSQVTALFNSNGDYVITTPSWDNAGTTNVGAVTWAAGDGSSNNTGIIGAATNSLFGRIQDDQIGTLISTNLGGFGHFMIGSQFYDNDQLDSDAGIAFMVNGVTGQYMIGGGVGIISDSRGLHGDEINDRVSSGGIYRVGTTASDFVVASPLVDVVSLAANAGAATFVSGTIGSQGLIGPAQLTTASPDNTNSLMGTNFNDRIGDGGSFTDGIIPLTGVNSGRYLVISDNWNGTRGLVHAATGAAAGDLDATNSIVGQASGDDIGSIAVPLSNGNFAVGSSSWTNNGAGTFRGAVTIGNGTTGQILSTSSFGAITSANSLFGANDSDFVGGNGGVIGLANGNMVVLTTNWSDGAADDLGAATLINGTTGEIASATSVIAGSPSASNSIVGTTEFDYVGTNAVDLGNGFFAILSEGWQTGVLFVGAVTIADASDGSFASSGSYGAVTASNSILGSSDGDLFNALLASLGNNHFIIAAPSWDNGGILDAGAVTHVNGDTGDIGGSGVFYSGVIGTGNSLVGSSQDDEISGRESDGFDNIVYVLANGDYVFGSPNYDAGASSNAGAITIGDGSNGSVGILDSSNSHIGDNANDEYGSGYFIEHFDGSGRLLSLNPNADSGVSTDNGNVFLIDPAGGAGSVSNVLYNDSAGSSLNIFASDLASTLSGGPVILQATNDITVNANVSVSGGGNTLTLQSGRSILINANIVTDGGDLFLFANDPNGFNGTQRESGLAVVSMLDGTVIDTGAGNLEIEMRDGNDFFNSGTNPNVNFDAGDITLADVIATHISITQDSQTDNASILRTTTGSITADSVFIDHFNSGNTAVTAGGIGSSSLPLNIQTDFLAAHIHETTATGIYISASPRNGSLLTIGDTCYGEGPCGFHGIVGIETVESGDIELFITGNLDINDPLATRGVSGNIDITVSENINILDGTGLLGDIDSADQIFVLAGGNFTFENTISGMSSVNNTTISADSIFLNASGTIDLTSGGAVSLDATTGTIFNGGATGSTPDVDAASSLILTAETNIELDFEATSIDATSNSNGNITLFDTSTGGTLSVIGLDNGGGGSIALEQPNGASMIIIGQVDSNGAVDLITDGDLTVRSDISSFNLFNISLIADNDLDGSGTLDIANPVSSALSITSDRSINLVGAEVIITGGTGTGENLEIRALNGDIDIDANNGDITITGGSAANSDVLIVGNESGVYDVHLDASGDVNLIAGSGIAANVVVQSDDGDLDGVEVTATNILFDISSAGTGASAVIIADFGFANVDITGNCINCNALDNPLISGNNEAGIWALNFSTATVFAWIGGASGGWDISGNWDLNAVPGINDDATIAGATVSIDNISLGINNLTLTNATLDINAGNDLTIAGTATFDASSSISIGTGGTLTTTAGGRIVMNGTTNIVGGGTAVINGVNNSFNILNMSGGPGSLLGTGSSTVSGPVTWTETIVAHNLTVTGDIIIDSGTLNARQTGGIVTIANASANQRINGTFDITGGARFINAGDLILDEPAAILSSDNTGTFENAAGGIIRTNSTSVTFDMGTGSGLTFITAGDIDASSGGGLAVNTTNPMQWNGGNWSGGGFDINTTLTVGGDAIKTLDGFTLAVDNPVNFTGQGDLDIINGGIFLIVSGGTTLHTSDAGILSSDSTGTFQIQNDTFSKNNSTTNVTAIFNNNFSVDISGNGTLILRDPTSQDDNPSNYNLSGNGRLEIAADRDFTIGGFNFTDGTFAVTNNANVNIGTSGAGFSQFHNLELNNPIGTNGITSSNTIAVDGTFDWLGGRLDTQNSTTPFQLQPNGILNLEVPNVALNSSSIVDGTVNIKSGGELIFTTLSPASFNGTFNLEFGGIIDVRTGATTLVNGLNGDGTLKISGSTTIFNLGTASTAGDLQISDGTLQGKSLTFSELSNVSGGNIQLDSGEIIDFAGGVDFSNTVNFGNEIQVSSGTTFGTTNLLDDGSGLFSFIVSGSPDDGQATSDTAFIINGTTTIEPGVTVDGGELNIASLATLDVSGTGSIGVINQNGGTLSGNGIIIGNVSNDANLNPGSSPGILTIDGNLALGANSALNLDLNDVVEAGIDYDVLDVTGSIIFGGDLNIVTAQGQTNIAVADEFAPVTYASSSGAFARPPQNTDGYTFNLEFGPNGVALKVLSIPGQDLPVDAIGTETGNYINTVENNDYFVKDVDIFYEVTLEEDEEEKQGTLICS